MFHSQSQNNQCSQQLSATGFVNDYCYRTGPFTSVQYEWPYQYTYSASVTCEGANTYLDFSGVGCYYNDGSDDDDYARYHSYNMFSLVSSGAGGGGGGGSKSLSTGAWVGVAFAALAGLGLIGAGVYYVAASRKVPPMSTQGNELPHV
jgi:hypothetical protein